MDRREAFADDAAWAGTVRTEAGVITGWHVHADYDTTSTSSPGRRASSTGQAGSSVTMRGRAHALRRADFEIEVPFGGFDRSPFEHASESQIWVARRPSTTT